MIEEIVSKIGIALKLGALNFRVARQITPCGKQAFLIHKREIGVGGAAGTATDEVIQIKARNHK